MKFLYRFACLSLLISNFAQAAEPTAAAAPHALAAAKVIVGDMKENQAFYQQNFGLKEVGRERSEGKYDEVILGFGAGTHLALFSSPQETALQKSRYPVVLIYTPDFETIVKRLEDTKQPVRRLPQSQSGPYRIAIARDPSGNAVEILAREQGPAIGAAKLIVADRQKAEQFYVQVFGAKPLQYFNTPAYDEVLLGFDGAMLALFQPKDEAPLPKSKFPVVAFRTSAFDPVLGHLKKAGLDAREVGLPKDVHLIIAKDPSDNVFEVIEH
jgi:catechol 2,3-dioxygenase-like lactoylglutathione lyase family enzyme